MDAKAMPLRPGYYQTNTGGKEHVTTRSIHGELSSYSVLPDGTQESGKTGWFADGTECHGFDEERLLLDSWQPCECHPVLDFILNELGYKAGTGAYEDYHVNLPNFPELFKQRLLDEIERRRQSTIAHLDYCQKLTETI